MRMKSLLTSSLAGLVLATGTLAQETPPPPGPYHGSGVQMLPPTPQPVQAPETMPAPSKGTEIAPPPAPYGAPMWMQGAGVPLPYWMQAPQPYGAQTYQGGYGNSTADGRANGRVQGGIGFSGSAAIGGQGATREQGWNGQGWNGGGYGNRISPQAFPGYTMQAPQGETPPAPARPQPPQPYQGGYPNTGWGMPYYAPWGGYGYRAPAYGWQPYGYGYGAPYQPYNR